MSAWRPGGAVDESDGRPAPAFRPQCHAPGPPAVQGQADLRLHVHLISDSTGETVTTVARAAVSQFEDVVPVEHVWFFVRTRQQLEKVLAIVEALPGLVIFTLASPELRHLLQERCHRSERALRAGARQRDERAGGPPGLGRPAADRAPARAGRGLLHRASPPSTIAMRHDDGQGAGRSRERRRRPGRRVAHLEDADLRLPRPSRRQGGQRADRHRARRSSMAWRGCSGR